MRKLSAILTIVAVLSIGAVGCSARSRTVKQETVQYSDDQATSETEPQTNPRVVETKTTETTESQESHRGLLGGTVDFVGTVLALPFRLVGGAIEAIF